MAAPRNIDELKERTLEQIFALKRNGVKVSGRKINEYLSDRDLTGPSHRNIMKSTPSKSMINNFKGKAQPHYDNSDVQYLININMFIGQHADKLDATLQDDCYVSMEEGKQTLPMHVQRVLGSRDRGARTALRAIARAAAIRASGCSDSDSVRASGSKVEAASPPCGSNSNHLSVAML